MNFGISEIIGRMKHIMSVKISERRDNMKERLMIRKRGQVTLPKSILERFNLEEGDILELTTDESGQITITPMIQVPVSQKWFWTEEWQKEEREADENIKTGHVKSFTNIDDALNWLDSDEAKQWAEEDK